MPKAPAPPHVIMARVREAYLDSGLSYTEIGLRMGYRDRVVAKAKAFQFVNLCRHPSAHKLSRFAFAVGTRVSFLMAHVRSPKPVTT